MDFDAIKKSCAAYLSDMTRFLRELIAIPGESSSEEGHARRILAEMEKLSFDEAYIDPQGNVIGFMGAGPRIIAFDGHIDTVGVGNISNWAFDPYKGYENEEEIGGRGASDQLGGLVSAVYGARVMKDLNIIPEGFRIMVVGSVQEEDCDGLCWQYIIHEDGIKPEFVVSTEPTDGGVYRGQRGRMEIRVEVKGVSCHGSAPERGDNAIYKMADILGDVRELNDSGLVKMLEKEHNPDWSEARFLGRGTITASEIFFKSPSRCAVADFCAVSLDRRMTAGETWVGCLEEIRELPSCRKYKDDVTVSMYDYSRPSWTGVSYPIECFFPTWVLGEDHRVLKAVKKAHESLFGSRRVGVADRKTRPLVDKWTFSTNGVSIMGRNGIPCVGYGPGCENQAHAPNEKTYKADLAAAAAIYSAIPEIYMEEK